MTAEELLRALRALGVRMALKDGKLEGEAPVGAYTAGLRAATIARRAEVVQLVDAQPLEPESDEAVLRNIEEFEERAGICEFTGCLRREHAELLALEELAHRCPPLVIAPVQTTSTRPSQSSLWLAVASEHEH